MIDHPLMHSPLGHEVDYPKSYDPALLFPIARHASRQSLPQPVPGWTGADIWNAYEISWLNPKGKPMVAVGRFIFPETSPNIIESKSFKLYLNSFNETRFATTTDVGERMKNDLDQIAQANVKVSLATLDTYKNEQCQPLEGLCIDGEDVEITTYRPAAQLLACTHGAAVVEETLMSDLLKSNCPVTGQPDWASLQICYTGRQIDRSALLKYIVSLRRHNGFHEHCVEQIYCDIWNGCRPDALCVYARYTRRGGVDINPWRSSQPMDVSLARTVRQ